MKLLAWVASLILAVAAAYSAMGLRAWGQMANAPIPLRLYALPLCILAAAVLLFPPLWRGENLRRWDWPRIIAAVILAGIGLLMPIQTHAVIQTHASPVEVIAPAH